LQGTPDSLLKSLCAYLDNHCGPQEHIMTTNEGNAVALVAGFHLATGQMGCLHAKFRLGKLLLIIEWRGEPGTSFIL